jgi:Tol biopolymer transport system component
MVLYGSTITTPAVTDAPGYQRGTGRYKWQFPPEMRIVEMATADAASIASGRSQPKVIVGDGRAYAAEGSTTRDGRSLLYCSLESGQGDLRVLDMPSGLHVTIVNAPGYDGGPFFSPDERRICYRSDRRGDSLLQVQVADLVRDADGRIVGSANERQLTDNEHVNWAPFWHPSGTMIVYASSEVGHNNYEIFAVTTDVAAAPTRTRVTQAQGADVLPVFDATGRRMMWTSQRGEGRSSQLWIADFVRAGASTP